MRILHIGMCTGENGFTKALRKVAITRYHEVNCGTEELNTKLRFLATDQWDIVFLQIQTPGIVNPQVIGTFRDNGACVFNFSGDVRYPTPQWYLDLAPHITSTLFNNMHDVKVIRESGANADWMEYGFDPEIYCPEGPIAENVPPIVFMGNNYGPSYFPLSNERIATVIALEREFDTAFGIYGNGWTRATGNFNHSQHEEAAIYRGAQIAINLSHFEYEKYSSDRLLRILGTGVKCINRWYPDCDPYIDSYKTIEDLIRLCHMMLEDGKYRRQNAQYECEFAHNNFTFDHMVQNLIKLYEQYK